MPCCLSSRNSHLWNFPCQFLIHTIPMCNIQIANLSSFSIDTPVRSAVPLLVILIPRWCGICITAFTVFILPSFGSWRLSINKLTSLFLLYLDNVEQVKYNGTILPWSAAQRRRIGVALFPFSHINIPLLFLFFDSVALRNMWTVLIAKKTGSPTQDKAMYILWQTLFPKKIVV